LHYVFSLAVVLNYASRKTIETAIVLLQNHADSALIAADGAINELGFQSTLRLEHRRGHFDLRRQKTNVAKAFKFHLLSPKRLGVSALSGNL
jgi:hypothetical protein